MWPVNELLYAKQYSFYKLIVYIGVVTIYNIYMYICDNTFRFYLARTKRKTCKYGLKTCNGKLSSQIYCSISLLIYVDTCFFAYCVLLLSLLKF